MKKIILGLMVLSLVFGCIGCGFETESAEDSIRFYYPRTANNYEYGSEDGVITYEERDPAGHRNNLRYLLTLYLLGPVEEGLVSPFPEGCQIVHLSRNESEVSMTINSNFVTLKGMDLTLACVCLAQTCFTLTDVPMVRIMAESFDGQIAIDEVIMQNQLISGDEPVPTETIK